MSEEASFSRDVQIWIQRIVEADDCEFPELVARLPGVDPALVVKALETLTADLHMAGAAHKKYSTLVKAAQAPRSATSVARESWAPFVPHPLDFDWRFTRETSEGLVLDALSFANPQRIALLGTPSLVDVFEKRSPKLKLRLFEQNPLWKCQLKKGHSNLEFVETDLSLYPVPGESHGWADVVVADPPWYPTAQHAYLETAVRLLRPEGVVMLSIPPIGTRPGIASERKSLQTQAEMLGLSRVELIEARVRYRTPPFEINALKAAGIGVALPEWRSGDLCIYRSASVGRGHQWGQRRMLVEEGARWSEVAINGVRIKIKKTGARGALSGMILPLTAGDVLPSVSARHPIRDQADVWTSGNRIFRCENSPALLELCEELRDTVAIGGGGSLKGGSPSIGDDAKRSIWEKVMNIVALEFDEYIERI